jgi:hypothetical protein
MTTKKQESLPVTEKLMCGIVMPISEIDGCTENHWKEVYNIIGQSIEKANFAANLVSNSDDVGVIQKRIIQNLYDNPIVIVDVSGKNPNVMFELGLRLAFDKPTIIIKDDKTQYSFDTSPIEHIEYPRDLRFIKIVEFKDKLTDKIIQTYKKAKADDNFSTFLKHFGSFKVAKIETEIVSKEDYILEEIKSLREMVIRNNRYNSIKEFNYDKERSLFEDTEKTIVMCFGDKDPQELEMILNEVKSLRGIRNAEIDKFHEDHCHIDIQLIGNRPKDLIIRNLERMFGDKVNYIR